MSEAMAGCRVLITRAVHQSEGLAAELRAAGAEVVAIPVIEILAPETWVGMDVVLRGIKNFEWMVLTSANAVDSLGQRMAAVGISAADFAGVEIAVVGPATARAVEAAGLRVALMPEEAVAEKLAESLRARVGGKNVLLLQAMGAREVLTVELARAGARVTSVEAYRNAVPRGSVDALRDLFAVVERRPRAVVFTSSSTVRNFFELMRASGIVLPAGVALASIGPVTSGTLRELGYGVDVEAEEHTVGGLVMALAGYFSNRGTPETYP